MREQKNKHKTQVICWRGADGDLRPVKCVCEDKFGYPYYCTDEEGDTHMVFNNTHFKTKEEAWQSIVDSVKAAVWLSKRQLRQAKRDLRIAEEMLATSTVEYDMIKENGENPFGDKM